MLEDRDYLAKIVICRGALKSYWELVRQKFPDGVTWNAEADSKQTIRLCAKAARCLKSLRATIDAGDGTAMAEDASRLAQLFHNLTKGSALMEFRTHIEFSDVVGVLALMIDSAPTQRRNLFLALLNNHGELDSKRYMELSKLDSKRVHKDFVEFKILNLVDMKSDGTTRKIKLKAEFFWILDRKILAMINNR